MRRCIPFLVCIVASLAAGFLGSFFTVGATSTWYAALDKPFWTPPTWVFAPVWTLLYILMGTAAALVWRSPKSERRFALGFFFVHLCINAAWSIVFFGLRDVLAAFLIIKVLWVCILILMILFWKHSRVASLLLAPYLLWITYAISLNLGIALMN